jgi:hypothetical protein
MARAGHSYACHRQRLSTDAVDWTNEELKRSLPRQGGSYVQHSLPLSTHCRSSRKCSIGRITLSNKGKQIRDSLKLFQIHPEFSRRKLLAGSPVPWLVEFNGLIVDARTLPSDVQAEARRKGLIPDLDE